MLLFELMNIKVDKLYAMTTIIVTSPQSHLVPELTGSLEQTTFLNTMRRRDTEKRGFYLILGFIQIHSNYSQGIRYGPFAFRTGDRLM